MPHSALPPASPFQVNTMQDRGRHWVDGEKDKYTPSLPTRNFNTMGKTEQHSKEGMANSEGMDEKEGFMEEVAFQLDNRPEE